MMGNRVTVLLCELSRERSGRGVGSPPTSNLWGPFSGSRPLGLRAHSSDRKEGVRKLF